MNTVVVRLAVVCVSIIVISLMLMGQSFAKIDPEIIVGAWLFDEGKGDREIFVNQEVNEQ